MKHTDVLKCLKIFLFAMIMICASGRCVSAVKRGILTGLVDPLPEPYREPEEGALKGERLTDA